jgi:hypothetical protein
MYHENQTGYKTYHTYTFDGFVPNPPFKSNDKSDLNKPATINTISDLMYRRSMLAPNVMKLFKEDIKVVRCGPLYQKRLRVVHSALQGQTGYVVIDFHNAPDSQDTKSIFTAFAIIGGLGVLNSKETKCVIRSCQMPFILRMDSSGWLSKP